MSDQAAPPTVPATTPQPTTLEQVVNNSLWNLPIPLPPGEAEPANPKDYKELHKAKVALLKKRLANLPTVTDEKTLDVNQKALTALVKVRTGLNKARQGMFESVKKLKEDVDRYVGTTAENGLQAEIKALETPIEEAIQGYRDELERKRQEAERVLEERNNARIAYVLGAGMTFDGQKYSLGELILWPVDLNNFGEPEWMGWIDKRLNPALKVAEEAKAAEEEAFRREAAEKEQKDKEMREMFERQRAEQERQDNERADLDRQKAALREEKRGLRRDQLVQLGAFVTPQPDGLDAVAYEEDALEKELFDLPALSDEQWPVTKQHVRDQVVAVMERNKENLRLQALEDERSLLLRALSHHQYDGDSVWTLGEEVVTDHQLRTFTSDEWLACLSKFERENARLDEPPAPAPIPPVITGNELPEVAGVAFEAPPTPPVVYPKAIPDEIRRLEGAVIELEAAMVSAGSSAEHTEVEAHRELFVRVESVCRQLHGEVSLALKTYRDAHATS